MTEEEAKKKYNELIRKRGSIKGRLTKFKNSLDILLSLETMSEFEISKLVMRLSKFEALFVDFDELQVQLESLCDDAQQAVELESRDIIEQEFYHCILTAQNLIKANTDNNDAASITKTTPCHHDSNCHNHMPSLKLPVIQIPKFDGAYSKWLEFKETFVSLVHNNDKIENVHKFYYLNSYLEGEAARVMANFEVSNQNYSQAWKLLCERFDNKRQLINNHLKSLFNFESVRKTDKSLRFYRTTNLDRYQRIEQARQHFWRRWTTEYVGELQQRTKWKVRCKDLCLNDLVVIKDDVAPPLCWRLGRIAKLYPGPDGVPRVADIATSRGTVKRAINKICVLSNSDNT
nr:uncharacterized protein LOC128681901 [Plodia interpunctella]